MIRRLLIVLVLLATAAGSSAAGPGVTVRLAPATPVDAAELTLADVAIVRCDDADLFRRACAVALGRAPWPNETILIDRRTILSRLAASGVRPEDVEFAGADEVSVTRFGRRITPEEIVLAARSALPAAVEGGPGPAWQLAAMPQEMFVPASTRVGLVPAAEQAPPNGRLRVTVSALAGQRRVASRVVEFTATYGVREAVAKRDIASGAALTPENVEVRTVQRTSPQAEGWQPPFGRLATRPIPAGAVVHDALAAVPSPAVVVKRNEPVVMRIAGDGFVVSTIAQAIEDGRPGDFIKVRNIDSKRIVVAKVAADGTVVPGSER